MRRMAAGNGALDLVQYAPREERGYCTLRVFVRMRAGRSYVHPAPGYTGAMPDYRRIFIPGGTYFFTVNLLERRSTLPTENIASLRHAIFWTKRRTPFRIEALVVLPDHLHAIFTLPEGDSNFPQRWRHIKSRFSRSLAKSEWRSTVREKRGERAIWQRRYWEHYIRDKRDLRAHIAYCYYNPVKHSFATRVSDWPHSTYHRDIRSGRFEPDFAPEDVLNWKIPGEQA